MTAPTLRKPAHKRIVDTVRAGSHPGVAAMRSGYTKSTLYGWLKRGAQGEEPYASFRADVFQAVAEAECGILEELLKLSENPESMEERKLREKVLVWMLERRFAVRWARTAPQTEYDTDDGSEDDARTLQQLLEDPEARELILAASHRAAALEGNSGGSGDTSE
jgi:hypothetical protein